MTIDEICKKYKITNYTINPDGSIDVNGDVFLYDMNLEELPLSFNKVSGNFCCYDNKLTTLKGSPKWVGDGFFCLYNRLTSLEFGPEYVGGGFFCNNNDLTNLVGSPKQVGGNFDCGYNTDLIDLKGCPEKIGGSFSCNDTPLSSIFNRVDRNFIHAFNFYKVVKNDTVNLKRLKYVMDLYDKPIDLKRIEKYYKII